MQKIRQNNKTSTLLFIFTLFLLFTFVLIQGCTSSTSSDDTQDGTDNNRPAGNIFIFTDTQKIYQYNIAANRFTLLNQDPYQPLDFAVSSNGLFVVATFPDSMLGLYNIPEQKWQYFNAGALLKGPVSSNIYGTIIAYTVLAGKQRRINLLYPQSGSIYSLDLEKGNWADYPLFERSAGNGLAYTQDNGFVVFRISNGNSVRLSDLSLIADDFSPYGQYVSASGKIFDLTLYQYYPSTARGEIQFVNESKIVYNKTSRKILTLAKLSGVLEESIYTGQDSVIFCISPTGAQIAFTDLAEQSLIHFYMFNPIGEITTASLPSGTGSIKKMYWRDSPVQGVAAL